MPETKPIALIVGLGNPGDNYRDTRHNVGFRFLDKLAEAKGVSFTPQAKFFGLTARISTPSGDVWLLKPTTFMNLSGSAVQALAAYYKITPDEVFVVHDELDLPPGTMKMKIGGGNAGHNGLKDITAKLSTPNFWRLRIGIGHPRQFCPQQAVYDWVLGVSSPEHSEAIEKCSKAALAIVDNLAAGNFDRVQRTLSKWGSLPKPPKEAKDKNEKPAQASSADKTVEAN